MNAPGSIARTVLFNVTLTTAALLFAGCVAEPVKDPGAERVRADLTALESNPDLANRAPVAMQEAERAVHDAETPDTDASLTAHRVYIADRKVQTAKSLAQAEYATDQRKALSDQSAQVQLEARTREADTAKSKNDELLAELADLKAKKTERGVEITLGDVLFSSGGSDLKPGSVGNLDKLASALREEPDRHALIEGHTDNQGGDEMNLELSQRRADAVSRYLTGHGVDSGQITSMGRGKGYPVAGNETAAGRQLNRRVEITIQNPPQ